VRSASARLPRAACRLLASMKGHVCLTIATSGNNIVAPGALHAWGAQDPEPSKTTAGEGVPDPSPSSSLFPPLLTNSLARCIWEHLGAGRAAVFTTVRRGSLRGWVRHPLDRCVRQMQPCAARSLAPSKHHPAAPRRDDCGKVKSLAVRPTGCEQDPSSQSAFDSPHVNLCCNSVEACVSVAISEQAALESAERAL
jgi:hypothetical protein